VLVKEMAQVLDATADAMGEEIARSGHVAVNGIGFDTGKATIKPESAAVLGEIVTRSRSPTTPPTKAGPRTGAWSSSSSRSRRF